MNKFSLSVILFLLFGLLAQSQSDKQSIKFYGEVYDDLGKTMVHAHILNISTNFGTLTNKDGMFLIDVFPEDSLRITSVGYKNKLLLIPYLNEDKIQRKIILYLDTISLSEAIIYPYPATIEALKREMLTLELEEDTLQIDLHLEMAGITPAPQTGVIISGPITALYNKFSRHAKIQQKYNNLVYQEQLKTKSSKIYTTRLVKRITGLESNEEVKTFMEFCDLEPEFILNSNEYELFCAINDCFVRYAKDLENN